MFANEGILRRRETTARTFAADSWRATDGEIGKLAILGRSFHWKMPTRFPLRFQEKGKENAFEVRVHKDGN